MLGNLIFYFISVGSSPVEGNETKEFAEWILPVGNGVDGEDNSREALIKLLDDILIHDAAEPLATIVKNTYPSILQNISYSKCFHDIIILSPSNEMVEKNNDHVMSLMGGKEMEYLSYDNIWKEDDDVVKEVKIYLTTRIYFL